MRKKHLHFLHFVLWEKTKSVPGEINEIFSPNCFETETDRCNNFKKGKNNTTPHSTPKPGLFVSVLFAGVCLHIVNVLASISISPIKIDVNCGD